MVTAATTSEPPASMTPMVIVIIVFVIGGIIYTFGYIRAVMHRANKDYKATKAAVPGLRKGFWKAWWSAVKVGTGVLVAIGILIYWGVSDIRERTDNPAPSASPSAKVKPRAR